MSGSRKGRVSLGEHVDSMPWYRRPRIRAVIVQPPEGVDLGELRGLIGRATIKAIGGRRVGLWTWLRAERVARRLGLPHRVGLWLETDDFVGPDEKQCNMVGGWLYPGRAALAKFDSLLRFLLRPKDYDKFFAAAIADTQHAVWDARRRGETWAARREVLWFWLSMIRHVPQWIFVLMIKIATSSFRAG